MVSVHIKKKKKKKEKKKKKKRTLWFQFIKKKELYGFNIIGFSDVV